MLVSLEISDLGGIEEVMDTEIFFIALGSIGSIIVAIVAIFGPAIQNVIFRPKLKLRLRSSLGEKTKTSSGVIQIYYHLEVFNEKNVNPGKNVRVFIKEVWKNSKRMSWEEVFHSGWLQLRWQFSNPYDSGISKEIGQAYVCDFGVIDSQGFRLLTYVCPNNFSGYLDCEGELKVTVIAQGDNAKSNELKLKIRWDGKWDENEKIMERNLIIEDITSQHS